MDSPILKTYGQIVSDHNNKNLVLEDDVREYSKAMEPDLIQRIIDCADEAKKIDIYQNKDFYIVRLGKIERLGGVPRNMVFARRSCPSPSYNQTVWKFKHRVGTLEYLWHLPGKNRYMDIIQNAFEYTSSKDKGAQNLAKFVLLDASGELLNWVKYENGELKDAIIKITH